MPSELPIQYCVIVGNIIDGVNVYGPYTEEELIEINLSETFPDDSWVTTRLETL